MGDGLPGRFYTRQAHSSRLLLRTNSRQPDFQRVAREAKSLQVSALRLLFDRCKSALRVGSNPVKVVIPMVALRRQAAVCAGALCAPNKFSPSVASASPKWGKSCAPP
jgi:hypothetical protein